VLGAIRDRLVPAAIAMGSVAREGTRAAGYRPYALEDPQVAAGLVDVLAGRKQVDEAVTEVVENLYLLNAGDPSAAREAVLNPDAIASVFSQLEPLADLVLIDSAPLLGASDSIALAIAADAIVVVADARHSERMAIDEVRRLLDRIGTPVLGSVLVNSDSSAFPYYYVERDRPEPDVRDRVRDRARSMVPPFDDDFPLPSREET
jgi:Mrp family chromosome partitioning ATPase